MGFRARVVNRERPLGRDRSRHWDGPPRRAQGGLTMLRREGKPLRWNNPEGIVNLVFPSRRGLLPAVRVFIDFLAERLPAAL